MLTNSHYDSGLKYQVSFNNLHDFEVSSIHNWPKTLELKIYNSGGQGPCLGKLSCEIPKKHVLAPLSYQYDKSVSSIMCLDRGCGRTLST